MSILSRDNRKTRALTRNAVMLSLAMCLSFLEHLLPLSLFLPLPGVKLGLANIVITVCFFAFSGLDATLISLSRIALSALLFGTPISLFFALCGGALSLLSLWLTSLAPSRRISFVGISILSATAHHIGQIFAACILFGSSVILGYLPLLLLAGLVTGGVTGALLNLTMERLEKIGKWGWKR